MNDLNIYISGLVALVPSQSGSEMKVVLMEHSRHEARVLYNCTDINEPVSCKWATLDRKMKKLELIVESAVSFGVDPKLANHVHRMKDLTEGGGKPRGGSLSYPKNDPNVLGVFTINRGRLAPDLCRCLEYNYVRGKERRGPKRLTEAVRLELGEGAKVTLKVDDNPILVDGKPILQDHTEPFWIVNQPDEDLWENTLKGQSKIEHFSHMYKLLDRASPIPFIPEATCKFGVDCEFGSCEEECDYRAETRKASGPIKCPVTLFEPTDF